MASDGYAMRFGSPDPDIPSMNAAQEDPWNTRVHGTVGLSLTASPESKLALSILYEAVRDVRVFRARGRLRTPGRMRRQQAECSFELERLRSWIIGNDVFFSLDRCCELWGIEPGWLRSVLLRLLPQRV